jgi:hypothetical protein
MRSLHGPRFAQGVGAVASCMLAIMMGERRGTVPCSRSGGAGCRSPRFERSVRVLDAAGSGVFPKVAMLCPNLLQARNCDTNCLVAADTRPSA